MQAAQAMPQALPVSPADPANLAVALTPRTKHAQSITRVRPCVKFTKGQFPSGEKPKAQHLMLEVKRRRPGTACDNWQIEKLLKLLSETDSAAPAPVSGNSPRLPSRVPAPAAAPASAQQGGGTQQAEGPNRWLGRRCTVRLIHSITELSADFLQRDAKHAPSMVCWRVCRVPQSVLRSPR